MRILCIYNMPIKADYSRVWSVGLCQQNFEHNTISGASGIMLALQYYTAVFENSEKCRQILPSAPVGMYKLDKSRDQELVTYIFTLESQGIFLAAMITMCFEGYLGIYFMIECRIVAFYVATKKAYSAHALYLLDCILPPKMENNEPQFITWALHKKCHVSSA